MRTVHKNRRHTVILSLAISFFLFLAFFTNCSAGSQPSPDGSMRTGWEASLIVSRHTSVNIVSEEVPSTSAAYRVLTHTSSEKSSAFRTIKSILAACAAVCMCIFCQYRIHRISEKTASRSQYFIIRFIHNTDGKKD